MVARGETGWKAPRLEKYGDDVRANNDRRRCSDVTGCDRSAGHDWNSETTANDRGLFVCRDEWETTPAETAAVVRSLGLSSWPAATAFVATRTFSRLPRCSDASVKASAPPRMRNTPTMTTDSWRRFATGVLRGGARAVRARCSLIVAVTLSPCLECSSLRNLPRPLRQAPLG